MQDSLQRNLRKNGIFTTAISAGLILTLLFIMVMGIIIYKSILDSVNNAEDGAAAIAMVFVFVIFAGLVIVMEGICAFILVISILGLAFGLRLLLNKNIEPKVVRRRSRILVVVCVFIYIIAILLLLLGVILFSNGKEIATPILCLLASGGLFALAILQTKNKKELNHIIKEMENKETNASEALKTDDSVVSE